MAATLATDSGAPAARGVLGAEEVGLLIPRGRDIESVGVESSGAPHYDSTGHPLGGQRAGRLDARPRGRCLAVVGVRLASAAVLIAVAFYLRTWAQHLAGDSHEGLQLRAVNCTATTSPGANNHPFCFKLALKPGAPSRAGPVSWEVRDGVAGLVIDATGGKSAMVSVENALSEPTSMHWHGLLLPYAADGTPMVSTKPLAPGEVETYKLGDLRGQSGTHFVHSHYSWQMQNGLKAFVIVTEDKQERSRSDGGDGDFDGEALMFLEDSIGRPSCEVDPTVEEGWKCDDYRGGEVRPWPLPSGLPPASECMCPIFRKPPCLNCTLPAHCPACPSTAGVDPDNGDDPVFDFCRYSEQQQPPLCLHCIYPLWAFYGDMRANGKTLDDPAQVHASPGSRVLLRIINVSERHRRSLPPSSFPPFSPNPTAFVSFPAMSLHSPT